MYTYNSNHDEGLNLFEILSTAGPFLFGWFAVGPFLGTYNRKATSTVSSVFIDIIPGWALSLAAALSIRGVVKEAVPPVPFIIVSCIATYLLLTLWRSLYVFLAGGTSDEEYRKSGVFEVFKMVGSLVKRW